MPNIISVTDLNAPELAVFSGLTQGQRRSEYEAGQGVFIAESAKVIEAALDAGYTPRCFLMEQRHIDSTAHTLLERSGDVPIYTAPREVLASLTGYEMTRGMLCAMQRRPLPTVEEVCAQARRIVVLERIADPANVGAIFRSAAALGVDGVLLCGCGDPLYRRAVRVSMGTVFRLPWTCTDAPVLPLLRGLGFSAAAMALSERAVEITDPALQQATRLALVLGSEGEGLRPETIDACDHVVRIPMQRGVDSLNVAAAAAVAFWQLRVR